MTIQYSKMLGGYIATIKRRVGGEVVRSFVAVKPTMSEVVEVALSRLIYIKK